MTSKRQQAQEAAARAAATVIDLDSVTTAWAQSRLTDDLNPAALASRNERLRHAMVARGITTLSQLTPTTIHDLAVATANRGRGQIDSTDYHDLVDHLLAIHATASELAHLPAGADLRLTAIVEDHTGRPLALPAATQEDLRPHVDNLPDSGSLPGARPGAKHRALADSEILLLRVHICRLARREALRPAALLILVEAGARPSEATLITPGHLAPAPRDPQAVLLPGVKKLAKKRLIVIPEWSRPLLSRIAAHHLISGPNQADIPMAYEPRVTSRNSPRLPGQTPAAGDVPTDDDAANKQRCKDRTKASAAASMRVTSHMVKAGVPGPPPYPRAVWKWRVNHAYHTGGPVQAQILAGHKDTRQTHDVLRINAVNAFIGLLDCMELSA